MAKIMLRCSEVIFLHSEFVANQSGATGVCGWLLATGCASGTAASGFLHKLIFCRCRYGNGAVDCSINNFKLRWRWSKDWTTEVRFPSKAEVFYFLQYVQTGPEAHPASYPMCTGGSFPGGKKGWSVKLTTHLHLVPG
jgi:hypothetical protein